MLRSPLPTRDGHKGKSRAQEETQPTADLDHDNQDPLKPAQALRPHLEEMQRWEAVVAQEETQLMAELERAGF